MPYIHVRVAGELSDEQKTNIADQFSQVMQEVAGKKPESTYIVFEEVPRNNWAVGGKLLSEKGKQ